MKTERVGQAQSTIPAHRNTQQAVAHSVNKSVL